MPKQKQPNILIFMTDQQRGSTVLPDSPVKTPVLDRFRQESVTFSNAFCPSPHCCPSRATMMTGLYPTQHGVWNNVKVANALSTGLNEGVRCWSEDLKEAGYRLDWNGKWHVSNDEDPDDRGFAVHTLTAGSRRHGPGDYDWNDYRKMSAEADDLRTQRNPGEILRPGWGAYSHYGNHENPFGDADHVKSAVEVIRSRDTDQPWCHYIGLLGPHDPYIVPQRFLDLYNLDDITLPENFMDRMQDKPSLYRRTRDRFDQLTETEHREALRHYYAFCSYEDFLFGQVLEALEQSGQAENTLVIYCSDHGDYMADHGLWCKGLPCFRGAYEIPFIVRWPGHISDPGRVEEAFINLADVAPTLLEAAGIQADRKFAGRSLLPLLRPLTPDLRPPSSDLRSLSSAPWRDAHFTQSNGNELYGIQRSVMTRDWKLVYNGFDYDELYDLKNDPDETVNLAAQPEYDETKRHLYQRLWQFAAEHGEQSCNSYIMTALAEYGPLEAFRGDS
jgi:arylsulfatase A-like enzyme